jgi:hypothetical protein
MMQDNQGKEIQPGSYFVWEVIDRPRWLGTLDNLIAVPRDMLDRSVASKLDARRLEVG